MNYSGQNICNIYPQNQPITSSSVQEKIADKLSKDFSGRRVNESVDLNQRMTNFMKYRHYFLKTSAFFMQDMYTCKKKISPYQGGLTMNKPRVIKDFEKLDKHIKEQIKLSYPYGFSEHLITFTNKSGTFSSALPFETEEKYYLIRMTKQEANHLIDQDEDFDDDGNLRDDIRDLLENKYPDVESLANEDMEQQNDID